VNRQDIKQREQTHIIVLWNFALKSKGMGHPQRRHRYLCPNNDMRALNMPLDCNTWPRNESVIDVQYSEIQAAITCSLLDEPIPTPEN